MASYLKIFTMVFFSVFLISCGGGGGSSGPGDNPTPENTVFNVERYSPLNTTLGTLLSISASGTLTTSGQTFDADFYSTLSNTGQATYQGETVNVRESNIIISVPSIDFSDSSRSETYYNNNGQIVFSSNGTVISQSVLPLTARIGDSGNLSVIENNAGERTTSSWELLDGGNGKADIKISFIIKDINNNVTAVETQTFKINTSGLVEGFSSSGSTDNVTYNFSG